MENLGIWRIWEFGEFRNLENLGIWRIWEFGEFRNLENLGEIVEFVESKTRSGEGILRSLRTCVQKHVAISFFFRVRVRVRTATGLGQHCGDGTRPQGRRPPGHA